MQFIESDAWLSLVERCVRDAEVAGSNPVASITESLENKGFTQKKHPTEECFFHTFD